MPVNRNALLRYKTIDHCLCNRYRQWTLDDLIEACSDALYEYEGIRKGISRRTIQLDIQTMRSDRLGYNAPIIVVDNKYYTYEDPDYSIMHSPLTEHDLDELSGAVGVLKQMVGFPAMAGIADLVSRLEDQVNLATANSKALIMMESNERLKGLNFVPVIYDALRRGHAQKYEYQSFRAIKPSSFVFYPYVLKEFNNRWFVVGSRKDNPKKLLTLALDRIGSIETLSDEPNIVPKNFDAEKYFSEMVGVSRDLSSKTQTVRFWASTEDAPYFLTKPIHCSQTLVEQTDNGEMLFEINVIINPELIRAFLGFGPGIRVVEPVFLANSIRKRHRDAADGILRNSR